MRGATRIGSFLGLLVIVGSLAVLAASLPAGAASGTPVIVENTIGQVFLVGDNGVLHEIDADLFAVSGLDKSIIVPLTQQMPVGAPIQTLGELVPALAAVAVDRSGLGTDLGLVAVIGHPAASTAFATAGKKFVVAERHR
jgi:hypothetical protein